MDKGLSRREEVAGIKGKIKSIKGQRGQGTVFSQHVPSHTTEDAVSVQIKSVSHSKYPLNKTRTYGAVYMFDAGAAGEAGKICHSCKWSLLFPFIKAAPISSVVLRNESVTI